MICFDVILLITVIMFLLLQIYIWQLKDNDLIGVAFIDTQVYTHQILTIKSLLLIADVYKSIALLRFQEEYRTLSLVSRVSSFLSENISRFFYSSSLNNPIFIELFLFYWRKVLPIFCIFKESNRFQDFKPCEVYSVEYMIDNSTLGFLVSDREKNLVLYMYQPEARESFGGRLSLKFNSSQI